MSDKIAKLESELALAKAEAAFVEKKQSGTLTAADKQELRALRQEYREKFRSPIRDGAAPEAIKVKAAPKKSGGE